MLALLYVFLYYRGSKCLFLSFFRVIVFQTLLPWWTFYTALFVYGNYLIKNQNMARIQGGHCPWSKIQGGRPTTLTPACREPGPQSVGVTAPKVTLRMRYIDKSTRQCTQT